VELGRGVIVGNFQRSAAAVVDNGARVSGGASNEIERESGS